MAAGQGGGLHVVPLAYRQPVGKRHRDLDRRGFVNRFCRQLAGGINRVVVEDVGVQQIDRVLNLQFPVGAKLLNGFAAHRGHLTAGRAVNKIIKCRSNLRSQEFRQRHAIAALAGKNKAAIVIEPGHTLKAEL